MVTLVFHSELFRPKRPDGGRNGSKCVVEERGCIAHRMNSLYLQRRMDVFVEGCEPLFLFTYKMITKTQVVELLTAEFGETPLFFVDIDVTGANDIRVLVDNDNGISISDCVTVSRFLESSFDREIEDFSLQVMSAGADQPFKVTRQYVKNVGRQVAVKLLDGENFTGELVAANADEAHVKVREKRRVEGRKSKEWVEEIFALPYENIKETKVIISFK